MVELFAAPTSETSYALTPIGVVRTQATEPVDENWGAVESTIVVEPALRPGLLGLDDFSHLIVVTLLHGAAFDPARHLQRHPRGRKELPLLGIFSQRAKDRPNPLGITCVPIVGLVDEGIRVRGLDAIDGTPVLDLKPHFPVFDSPPNPRTPVWVDELMRGYF
jgi:tRNA-Thr(GGU) m(6)t(6)A37 methyltransferase TsaA